MRKRYFIIVAAVVVAVALVATFVSAAWAVSWTDLSDSTLASYGITNDQVAQISQGYSNGLWRPDQQITRAQFAKMACLALGIAQSTPAIATFMDVKPGSPFYPYVEGAAAAGLVHGVSVGHYSPDSYVTREQGLAIIARAIAYENSVDLDTVYTPSQVSGWLGSFSDGTQVSTSLRSALAFATNLNIARSSEGDLRPRSWLTRIEAAAYLIRAQAPSVGSVSPGQGSPAGGETVTITGHNFSGVNEVKFGSVDASSFSVVSDTQIAAVVPAGTIGSTVNVVVINAEGSSTPWDVSFTYSYAKPVISSLSPNTGSPNGGNTAIIIGAGFTGATAVQFGGVDATSFTIDSDTHITAIVPAGTPGAVVDVTVVGPSGTSAVVSGTTSYTYRYPGVTSISPTHGPVAGGNTVTVYGIGFSTLSGPEAVHFGEKTAANIQIQSDTKLTAVVPSGTAGQSVGVYIDGQQGSGYGATYSYDDTYISTVTAAQGPFGGGNTVTISGNGLTNVSSVYFGNQPSPSISVMSDSQIKATVPAYAGGYSYAPQTVQVSVRTIQGKTATWQDGLYTYDVPSVYSLSAGSGGYSGGYQIEVYGVGFECGNIVSVYFGSASASFKLVDDNELQVLGVPGGAPGSKVNVVVVNSYGSSIDQVTFTYNSTP